MPRLIGNGDAIRHHQPTEAGRGGAGRGASDLDRRRVTVGAGFLLVSALLPSPGRAAAPDTPVSDVGAGANVGRPAGSGIAGRVRTSSGRRVSGVVVMVEKLDPPPVPIPELANSTDHRGRFFWPLPRGRYRLRFLREGRAIAERVVTVSGAEVATEIDVVIGKNAGR